MTVNLSQLEIVGVRLMSKQVKPLDELLRDLPPESQVEVRALVESLMKKRKKKSSGKLRQKWAGALSDFREEYTALELQKKALDWRGD